MKQLARCAAPRHVVAHLGDPHLVGADLADAREGVPLERARELASSTKSQLTNQPCRGPFPCDSC